MDVVGRARRCRGRERGSQKRGSNSLDRRGSKRHPTWKGSSSILLRMLHAGEIIILEKGRHERMGGVSGVPLLMKHRIRRPHLGGSEVCQRVGRWVVITSRIGVEDDVVVVDKRLMICRGRRGGALSFCYWLDRRTVVGDCRSGRTVGGRAVRARGRRTAMVGRRHCRPWTIAVQWRGGRRLARGCYDMTRNCHLIKIDVVEDVDHTKF